MRRPLLVGLLVTLLVGVVGIDAQAVPGPTRTTLRAGSVTVVVQHQPFGLAITDGRTGTIVDSPVPLLLDPLPNLDRLLYDGLVDGIDWAYPGLQDVTYQPLAYRTSRWQRVTGVRSVAGGHFELATSDGAGATLDIGVGADGNVELSFVPRAAGVQAVEGAFSAPLNTPFFGGGQRFMGANQRGFSVPLWISHGNNADRRLSTNEIAAPFLWTPRGWGFWASGHARGEMNVGVLTEHPFAANVVLEDARLDLVVYLGSPSEMVSEHTARSGRPEQVPPDWAWEPMVWQDDDTSTASVLELVDGMQSRGIPLGAVWLDNPWDAGKATFDFDPSRFADPDQLIRDVHDRGVRIMAWISPFVTDPLLADASAAGFMVTGTRPDGNDATYLSLDPFGGLLAPRGIDQHLDFTNPAAVDWWKARLSALVARGIDGVKIDRGEEDLSDGSVWANGLPNRLNHNQYVSLFHQAAHEAFAAVRPDGDFFLISRGGYTGDSRWTAHWAADNMALPGFLGLRQALNSLLSLSVSGFPYSGADIGGYTGTRSGPGDSGQLGLPLEGTYLRWLQLGALSPVMQTDVPPWWVSDRAVRAYRLYATLHHRLVPYIASAARRSVADGVPIVRPMAYAFPDDPRAWHVDDQYLFGDDLLVAPVVSLLADVQPLRTVYLPAGRWTDFWTGQAYVGPTTLLAPAPIDRLPLYVRDGAVLPPGVNGPSLLADLG